MWLEKKHYRTGESRKLAQRRDGPWTVTERLPNGVNVSIRNSNGKPKIVHHDQLIPSSKDDLPDEGDIPASATGQHHHQLNEHYCSSDCYDSLEEDNSDESDYEADEIASLDSNIEEQEENIAPRYPVRNRQARKLTGVVPWDSISL